MGDVAAQWFTDFLATNLPAGQAAMQLRLVRFDPEHKRASNKKWTKDIEALNQFSDGYPVLVASEASVQELNGKLRAAGHEAITIERFRPNIVLAGVDAHDEDRVVALHIDAEVADPNSPSGVELALVKPCPRCPIPNIDPQTALSSPQVGDMLQTYRQDARVDGAVTFGMNAITRSGFDAVLRVGQVVRANYAFD